MGALARAWSAHVARLHSPCACLDPVPAVPALSSRFGRLASPPLDAPSRPPPPPLVDANEASAAARSRLRSARWPSGPSGPLAFAAAIAARPSSAPLASASRISGPSRPSPAFTHWRVRSSMPFAVPFPSCDFCRL